MAELTFEGEYQEIPVSTQYALIDYVTNRVIPGDFLRAVICNNLSKSITHADDHNQRALVSIVRWLYNRAPGNCWGSVEAFEQWTAREPAEP